MLVAHAQQGNGWLSNTNDKSTYRQALNLEMEDVRKNVHHRSDPEAIYLASLSDVLELLITENESLFDQYESAYEKRLRTLSKVNPKTADVLFTSAELRLQWAFVYLKFGHEFDAAWNIRQSYSLTQDCRNKYPRFSPVKKTSGLLNLMLGSVPDKYQWVLSMLAMQGSVEKGIQELTALQADANPVLAQEASLILYLAQGLILQQPQLALAELSQWPEERHMKLSLFLSAVLSLKNAESEKALEYLNALKSISGGLTVVYADYLLGEAYLHKGDYTSAITAYQNFLNRYSGVNFVKDCYYKIAICYWLLDNPATADEFARKGIASGREHAEADRYAARSLSEKEFPNPQLAKIRYAIDGGYYDMAAQLIEAANPDALHTEKERTEFIYRKARLYHKLNQEETCMKFYLQAISMSGDNPWYFAPNACLQLGYLFRAAGNDKQAAFYFKKALSYKKHEYKNSIDSKARSALDQIRKEK
ncbi:tetratricopeptide repeat protein [Oscillatoria amoena NRMC-F 0135]|nr:tetratricopeptide repeat protein [Oscillatoria amoena NRMC-F 0135]